MRLIIVSNRLPVTLKKTDGKWKAEVSSGGLVSGLSSWLSGRDDYLWVGWPGVSAEEVGDQRQEIVDALLRDHKSYPVFLDEKTMDEFYLGFCNKTIWPLFHYFPFLTSYEEKHWNNYVRVNEIFHNALAEFLRPDDVVWVHDYHLMLLPKLLKNRQSRQAVGFFLHIPFPSFELFRLLPRNWARTILEGIMASDLVGFHTHDYTQYFLRCVIRYLGYENNLGVVQMPDRVMKADTFPMGIDFGRFHDAAKTPEVRDEQDRIRAQFPNRRIIFSVDRQDYSKGILNRLQGYQAFLKKYPEWNKKVVFVMVIIPSRIGVREYQKIQTKINELIGEINGEFGSLDWTPMVYQYRPIPFEQMVALYSLSDAALITPLRDGMNLVAKEFVASSVTQKGVLILSELAGAAMELGEAILINPNNIAEIADALNTALTLPERQQVFRMEQMQDRLRRYDVSKWATDFLDRLASARAEQARFDQCLIDGSTRSRILESFAESPKRQIFLDYDGTLVPFKATPDEAQPGQDLVALLKDICLLPHTALTLISGRPRKFLEEWFGNLRVNLVAEHGTWTRKPGEEWVPLKALRTEWKEQILPILTTYKDRLPRSFIEEKTAGLAWHYRKSDPELAAQRVQEYMDEIIALTANMDLQIFRGHKVVEIRVSGINKGEAALHFLNGTQTDFILAAGDDMTDEDLFRALPPESYSIKVGMEKSYARYNLRSQKDVIDLLKDILTRGQTHER